VIDVKKVIAWVREHAHEYGVDPGARRQGAERRSLAGSCSATARARAGSGRR
jgi:hypothetical protein